MEIYKINISLRKKVKSGSQIKQDIYEHVSLTVCWLLRTDEVFHILTLELICTKYRKQRIFLI